MHYYSQFNERERKMACWFLLSVPVCLALKVEILG